MIPFIAIAATLGSAVLFFKAMGWHVDRARAQQEARYRKFKAEYLEEWREWADKHDGA